MLVNILLVAIFGGLASYYWVKRRELARIEYIRNYPLPKGLMEKLSKVRPELATKDHHLVARALRKFFLAYLKSGRKPVAMPSQVVDDLWHEFILYTRHYELFCKKAFGKFLHHTPAVVLGSNRNQNIGLRRAWWFCCKEENINPKKPTRLPLLFAIDTKLGVPDGFRYAVSCDGVRRHSHDSSQPVHCGGDFSSPSFDGTTDGLGDSSSSHDGHGGCSSSGCTADGCSGGCGGD